MTETATLPPPGESPAAQSSPSPQHEAAWVLPLEATSMSDVPQVGGKNASLGEMMRHLAPAGVRIPEGFAITAAAYRATIAEAGLDSALRGAIEEYRGGRRQLHHTGEAIRSMIANASLPARLVQAVRESYRDLCERTGVPNVAVAVRSSATAEDLPDASFAGQQETLLNVAGEEALLAACRTCYASLFTDRAISYREAKGFDHFAVALSIGVQRMVRADKGGSGVMFSLDTETGFPNLISISAAWGLGEPVVQGSVDPDLYRVFKPLLANPSLAPIVERKLGGKARKMRYARKGTRIVATSRAERRAFVLRDEEVLTLARWAVAVEAHYGRPMDMEWAKDGVTGELFMVQARPETVHALRSASTLRSWRLDGTGKLLVTGSAVGQAIASGPVCLIRDARDIERFPDGAILVTEMTDPDWVPVMRRAAGIVTDHGGSTSHAAIVSRELGVPAVVGTGSATRLLRDGDQITLSCAQGEEGRVLEGLIPFSSETIEIDALPRTRTELMLNLADPDAALAWWLLPARGVGLARMEFIVSNHVRVHPMALVHPERVSDPRERRRIAELTQGHADPRDYFVSRLALGIAKIASVFHPHPAIVRLSDFKTNEYAGLLGGRDFEPREENPMLGFRGASRYYHERYREGFALECRALKQVRETIGLSNVVVMVPFCRTPEEARLVLAEMAANGLVRGENGLEIYMMCEIPSNIVLAEEFSARFDGFSIGSNDLTQLMLGIDRDSDVLAPLFDERSPAVTRMIADFVRRAQVCGAKVGICGQAPSNYPEFARFLVEHGIDSISLNPDSFVPTLRRLAEVEQALDAERT
ncbi:phosphoenolpyruvate synthase [Sphingomonas sp. LB-2]|uniref:phosphoenolpyruvate synthase n=1 Tax=Sphingomonas caeni TaxID=2984949 RepID=UPI00222E65D6|nr:phosphoenolpyruvate synthase [Sphingomonas caeni]MCW3846024.1 phosphoenolpyruvate synthase [Sphingomonas caeni]